VVGQHWASGWRRSECFGPRIDRVGGELSAASDYLIPARKVEMKNVLLDGRLRDSEIVVPVFFGSDAAIMGGVGIVFQSVLPVFDFGPKHPEKDE